MSAESRTAATAMTAKRQKTMSVPLGESMVGGLFHNRQALVVQPEEKGTKRLTQDTGRSACATWSEETEEMWSEEDLSLRGLRSE